ncbi:DSBA oxidoreductase [Massilia sp. WF1]|uniref:DsbA family oxidoreductase n=1 Tax=unclassified Massilia TaxID=2609279 RepID=UPI00064B70D9|nr:MULTISPECIES: DsbA family protein [unclassified Massilia]ALK95067.1 disulfide bond formation protein DsbA [Massilia sp. WG5]KLU35677.1 DSBA oxidoreductase [Massilia sp. WF1]
MDTNTLLRIDVWSDYVCPFCYLELPALQRLQQRFGAQLTVVWRAFELRPDPKPTLDPDGDYLHDTWNRAVYPMAEQRGMLLRLPPVQPRSRLALEAAAFAESHGRFAAMHEALFRGFFAQGRDIGDLEVLCAIGQDAGLDAGALRQALQEGRHTAGVLDDERLAQALGVSGVPILFLRRADAPWEQALPLRGAVPYETIELAVRQLLGQA